MLIGAVLSIAVLLPLTLEPTLNCIAMDSKECTVRNACTTNSQIHVGKENFLRGREQKQEKSMVNFIGSSSAPSKDNTFREIETFYCHESASRVSSDSIQR